jgi:PAS domain S-box-containing protein
MKSAYIPNNEKRRLEALKNTALLDTPPEERFDRLSRLVQKALNVPIALVSLVDEHRQWFKSKQGLAVSETSRDVAFCAYTILSDEIFEVSDTLQDERFSDNPLVEEEPNIRFYAACPISSVDGYRIGTLCVIDTQPRKLSQTEKRMLRDISAAVQDEIRLTERLQGIEKSEQRLQSILEGTNVGTWEWNIQTGETVFNERWADIVGYKLSELEPISIDTWISLAHPDDLNESNDLLERHFRGESEFYDFEARMRHKKGHWVWVHDRGRIVSRTESGEPLIMSGTHEDITQQKQSQNELENQLAAFRALNTIASLAPENSIEQIAQGIKLACDYLKLELGILSSIDKQLKTYEIVAYHAPPGAGLRAGQTFALHDTYCEIVMSEGQLVAIHDMASSTYRQHPCYEAFGLESYIGLKIAVNDEPFGTLNFSSEKPREEPFKETEKQFLRLLAQWVSSALEFKQKNDALENSESRLRGLFELSPIGIALNEYDTGQFVDLNNALLAPTGYTREEFVTLSYWDVTPREYEQQELEQLEKLAQTGRYGPFEKEYIRKDGSRYPVLLNGMVVHDDKGKKLIWSIIEDISDRKRNEQIKTAFISTVSHELRTPITSISGALDLLQGGACGELPSAATEMVKVAKKNSERMNLLINDILDLEKLLAGRMQMQFEPVQIGILLNDIVKRNTPYSQRFNVRLILSPVRESLWVYIDAQRFEQVMANLISNAIKFSPKDEIVTIDVEDAKDSIRISVKDNGDGIPEDFQPRVFEKFAQANSNNTRATGGTGLGLSISKEIVERLGGNIDFSTGPDGTDFFVTLPKLNDAETFRQ